MKKLIIVFISVLTLISCSKDDQNYVNVSGKVIDENTNAGIPNIQVNIKSKKINSPGNEWSYWSELDNKTITTDQNGNFSIPMKIEDSNNLIEINKYDNNNYSENTKSYTQSEVGNVIIKVKKYEVLKIIVKNTNPFNSNDRISVDGISDYYLLKRENFGVQNEKFEFQTGIFSDVNIWLGTNVNSAISYRVTADSQIVISKSVRKNNTETLTYSPPINIIPNQINEYHINY